MMIRYVGVCALMIGTLAVAALSDDKAVWRDVDAHYPPHCEGKVVHPLPSDDLRGMYPVGTVLPWLGIGAGTHDGQPLRYALPKDEEGVPADTIQLLHCRAVPLASPGDMGQRYTLRDTTEKGERNRLREDMLNAVMIEHGLSMVASGWAADAMVNHSQSACGQAAQALLEIPRDEKPFLEQAQEHAEEACTSVGSEQFAAASPSPPHSQSRISWVRWILQYIQRAFNALCVLVGWR